MAKLLEKVRQSGAEYLESGEEPLAAISVKPSGATAAMGRRVGGGALLGAVLNRNTRKAQADTADAAETAGLRMAPFMALVVTPSRLLALELVGLAGKVQGLLGDVPIGEVEDIDVKRQMRTMTKQLTVKVRGAVLAFETTWADPAEDFAETLTSARGTVG